MREILFRAKTFATWEWVYGSYILHHEGKCQRHRLYDPSIIQRNACYPEIRPETLGQYTGMKDKNGKRIFEGDCINHPHNVVEYLNGEFCVAGDRPLSLMAKHGEVIGNIHDNPGLLIER